MSQQDPSLESDRLATRRDTTALAPVARTPSDPGVPLKILVLGATSGIAEATCRIWAAQGASLFLVARNPENSPPSPPTSKPAAPLTSTPRLPTSTTPPATPPCSPTPSTRSPAWTSPTLRTASSATSGR